jgi:hypothetical protein
VKNTYVVAPYRSGRGRYATTKYLVDLASAFTTRPSRSTLIEASSADEAVAIYRKMVADSLKGARKGN